MVRFTGYKGIMRQFSIVVVAILVLYLVLVRPLTKQSVNALQDEIELTTKRLERYLPKQEGKVLPTRNAVSALKKQLEQEQDNYQQLKRFIDPARDYLPEGTAEAGLYFTEKVHIVSKRLSRQANTLKIKIPETLGFSTEVLPEETEDIELLLKGVDVVDRVMTLLMEEGVYEISLVKTTVPIEQRDQDTEKLVYKELPVQLSFLCTSPVLIKVLYQMKNFSPVLVVKDIIVKRTQGDFLQIDMLLSRLVVS